MTNEQLYSAFLSQEPVKYFFDGDAVPLFAESIKAYTERIIAGCLVASAEVMDEKRHTVYIVPARNVDFLTVSERAKINKEKYVL